MGFKGIFGWLGSRGKKKEEKEEDSPEVAFAKRILKMDMERDMDKDRFNDENYRPKKRMQKRRIPFISPTALGMKCVKEKRLFPKLINGKKVVFRVIFLSRSSPKYFTCGRCKVSFRGLHYVGKIGKWVFLCTKCFNVFPDYVEAKIELSEEQRRHLSGILDRSRV